MNEAQEMCAEPLLFYEDMEPGGELTSPAEVIERDELVWFANTWDPIPFHIDEEAGIRAFGSLTVPGLYMLAVKQRLVHRMRPLAVIARVDPGPDPKRNE